jgi:hypothetical protein
VSNLTGQGVNEAFEWLKAQMIVHAPARTRMQQVRLHSFRQDVELVVSLLKLCGFPLQQAAGKTSAQAEAKPTPSGLKRLLSSFYSFFSSTPTTST